MRITVIMLGMLVVAAALADDSKPVTTNPSASVKTNTVHGFCVQAEEKYLSQIGPLRALIFPASQAGHVGDDIVVHCVLSNAGPSAVTVGNGYWGPFVCCSGDRMVSPIRMAFRRPSGPPKFDSLAAGECRSEDQTLRIPERVLPGPMKIRAAYILREIGTEMGYNVWTGMVRSAAVEITVQPQEPNKAVE